MITEYLGVTLLEKGKGRNEEEELITECAISLLSKSCGLEYPLPEPEEEIKVKKVTAEKPWKKLFNNKVGYISNNKNNPELIFPGSFNPLHEGHLKMRELAEKKQACIQHLKYVQRMLISHR